MLAIRANLFFLATVMALYSGFTIAEPSTCYGTTSRGRLENGVLLPASGKNFVSYSTVLRSLGRTYVHSTVKQIMIDSYQELETLAPGRIFKYAETGFRDGGRFSPHKTHQNGLSVDFMVPMMNSSGESVHLPTHAFNKYGYDIELDSQGRLDDLQIDYGAMAAHIESLEQAARRQGGRIWRVIFDPKLQPFLFKTPQGQRLKQRIRFSEKPSWVRHDEHYHVDFAVQCQPLK